MGTLKKENCYYEMTPRVVRANRETTITLQPLYDHVRFRPDAEYAVSYFPTEEFAQCSGWPQGQRRLFRAVDGVLRIPQYFEGEQEHVLWVEEATPDGKPLGDFRVYSVADDLWARKAFKGDLHMHSYRSDGHESPAYVAAACRKIGLDFMAVTDHHRYQPSLEAIRAFEGVDHDLAIFPGEEVHPPDNPAHIINFGGRFSINERFAADDYRAGVEAIQATLGDLPPGVDAYQYASCCWCFDRIREAGGLSVFCHPYWFTSHRYTPSGALTAHLLDQQPFDAFELIGGFFRFEADSNTLQVARYHEERARGKRIPIVGSSDAHGCERGELFGWYYTIVFAPTLALADLSESVKGLYSVAVEALPGETARAYGPFRLVKYALFLMREVMPQHDELCAEEGRLMLAHLAGDPSAATGLSALQGRTGALLDRYWASS